LHRKATLEEKERSRVLGVHFRHLTGDATGAAREEGEGKNDSGAPGPLPGKWGGSALPFMGVRKKERELMEEKV